MSERAGQQTEPGAAGTVRVRTVLFGNLAGLLPPGDRGRTVVEVKVDATVGDVLDVLAVPQYCRSYLTLDGERADGETPVRDGSELRVIVPLGGG